MTLGIAGIAAIAGGSFMFGFLIAAVMAAGGRADDQHDMDASEQ